MALHSKETQDLNFWEKRFSEAVSPLDAVGYGFDWKVIDQKHKEIISRVGLTKNDKILDIACGIGRTCRWWNADNYTGIDFFQKFIDVARKENPGYDFRTMNIMEPLPFKDYQFDWGLMISVEVVIQPVVGEDKWNEALKEMKRVCKRILLLEYANSDVGEIERSWKVL